MCVKRIYFYKNIILKYNIIYHIKISSLILVSLYSQATSNNFSFNYIILKVK